MTLYDKTGREILVGDVLKVFRFEGARRKRYYMYKQVVKIAPVLDITPLFYRIRHIDLTDDCYYEPADGRRMLDWEIVSSLRYDHYDRVRQPRVDPPPSPARQS